MLDILIKGKQDSIEYDISDLRLKDDSTQTLAYKAVNLTNPKIANEEKILGMLKYLNSKGVNLLHLD